MRRPSPPAEGEAQTGPLILYSLLTGGLAGGAALLASLALKAVEARVGGLLGYLPPGPPGEGGLGQAFTGPSSPLLPPPPRRGWRGTMTGLDVTDLRDRLSSARSIRSRVNESLSYILKH